MRPGALTIRGARREELDALSDLLVRAYAELEELFPWRDRWQDYLADVADVHGRWGQSRLFVAELDGALVGSVDYYAPDSGGYRFPGLAFPPGWSTFRCLGTDPDRRGMGIGRAMVAHLIERARGDGASHLAMHSASIMAAAGRMYGRMGFSRRPEHDFHPLDGSPVTVVAFALPLDPSASP